MGYAGVVFIIATILTLTIGNEHAAPVVLISGTLILMLVFGSVFLNEQYEEKHKGYNFLDTLPINADEIVSAKFGLVLVTVIILASYLLLLFSVSKVAPNDWILVRSYILMSGVVCLMLAALSYLGIFSFGYTKFVMIVMSFIVLLGFVPILIMKFYRDNLDVLIENILSFLRHVNWLAVIPLVLIGYFCLMFIAIKIKE